MRTKLVNKDIKQNYVNELLMERGLTAEEIDYFLNVPDNSYLEDPALLDNIDKMATHFENIINLTSNDRIVLCVDSDCDGFGSAAIFIQYVRKFNTEVQIEWVLHKSKGHGLSDTIDEFLNKQNNNPNIKYVIVKHPAGKDEKIHNTKMETFYNSPRWKELEDEGFIIYDIEKEFSQDFTDKELMRPDHHPSAKAWNIFTNKFVKDLNL